MGEWCRRMAAGGLGAVIAAGAAVVFIPAHACACGTFLLPQDADAQVAVTEETAVISWDGRRQRIILSLEVDSPSDEAALLIPTPSPASVEIGAGDLVAELAHLTEPRVEVVDVWWPQWLTSQDLTADSITAGSDRASAPVQVRGIEVEVLDASDADQLEGWLRKNEFVVRDEVASALAPYMQQGWYFTLVKLDADALRGRLQSLDVSFDTNQVVYPMRLGVAGGPVMVRTYVFAEHRMERTDSMGGQLTWAGPITQTDFVHQTLVDLAGQYPFLTAWEQYFADPPNQIDRDMVFAAASADTPYEQVRIEVIRHELFGAPAGPTVVFAGLIALGLGGGIYSRVRRRRGRPRMQV